MAFSRTLLGSVMAFSLGMVSCGESSQSDDPAPGTGELGDVTYDAVYVVNGGSNSVSVLDAAQGSVQGTIPLKGISYPHHINMSPDRSMFMVAAPGMDLSAGHGGGMDGMKGSLLMIDAKTGETMTSRQLDSMAHNAIFSPDGKEIWTALMTMPGKVLILDVETLETSQSINVGNMPAEVTFSSNGKYAFIANGMSNTVTVVDVATKQTVKEIAVGEDPVGAWTGSDGKMYVDNEEGKSISAIDVTSLADVRTYNLGFTPGMAILAPSGELWVTDNDAGKITYFMKDSTMVMGSITVGKGAHGLAFTADGKMAFVTNQGEGTVSMVDVASHSVMKTTTVGQKPNGLIFRQK